MSDNRSILSPLLLGLAVLLAGDVLLVWPSARAANLARREVAEYQPMLADLPQQVRIVDALAAEVEKLRRRAGGRDARADGTPSLDEILGALRETSGGGDAPPLWIEASDDAPDDARLSEPGGVVTVRTAATFDSVFALIRRVEAMNDAVHLVEVRIDGPGFDEDRAAAVLAASLKIRLASSGPDAGSAH